MAPQLPLLGECTLFVSDICGFDTVDGMDPESLARLMNQTFQSFNRTIVEAGGFIVSTIGDATIAIWDASHVAPSHAELAINCGQAILQQRQKAQSEGGICSCLGILIATGKMTGAMIGGHLQFVGDPWITIKRLESFKISGRSQMFYTSKTLAHLTTQETPKPIGRIKEVGGNDAKVQTWLMFLLMWVEGVLLS
jgi:class 3 adenylate cyclase